MEKFYQIQCLDMDGEIPDYWYDRVGATFPFTADGLDRVVKDFRYMKKSFSELDFKFRVVVVSIEVLDILT
jgi:hypothetical protein